ncbi:MAG: TetR/AcrR family transcriptional regulator [Armatimonadota bacterium]|nr:TetR/AcrR family transcriptional regulator [Armatimonadota bacterium]MDR5697766.1 TetR/AcrR family transcriptional regulator [Armatimonadota bacterium]
MSHRQTQIARNNHRRLLDAAARLFRAKGYAATGIRDLSRALRMETASLYHYMDGKEGLLYEIARRSQEDLAAAVAPIVVSDRPPLEKVRSLMTTHMTIVLRDRDKYAVLLSELKALSPRRRAAIVRLRDAYERMVDHVLAEGQGCGVLRTDVPVRYLRLALLNLLNWSIYWYRPNGPLTPEALAAVLSAVFLDGARARRSVRRSLTGTSTSGK